MVNVKAIGEWFAKADEDYRYAKASLDEGFAFYDQICFHLHQAAEKYLKAYIVAKELEFRKVHDLTKLLQICEVHDNAFEDLRDEVRELNPFYIETRYPGFINTTDKAQTEKAISMVEKIADLIKSKLAGEVIC
jgi:HEPN domain-containing protein